MRSAVALGFALASPAAFAQPAPGELAAPVTPACVSSPFGPRHVVGPRAAVMHLGIDLPAPAGAAVRAAAAGRVVALRRRGSDGLEIDLAHDRAPPAQGYVTRYAHLGSVAPPLAEGKRVIAAGERLGVVGRTGITYGTHVHFEVRIAGTPVDPLQFIALPFCR